MFNSKLYWITGDINVFDDFAVEVLYTSKTILEENGFALPYKDVLEGSWTIEKMYTLAKACEQDLDGNGKILSARTLWDTLKETTTSSTGSTRWARNPATSTRTATLK